MKEQESVMATAEVEEKKNEVTAPTQAHQLTRPDSAYDDFEGEIGERDLKVPRIQQVQSMGPLKDEFPLGSWVLNRESMICPKDKELHITVLRVKKVYEEVTEFGDGPMPRRFNTSKEVDAAGLRITPDWDNDLPAEVKDVLECVVAIRLTDEVTDTPDFAFEHNGERYALAQWVLSGYHSYNAVAPALITRRTFHKKPFAATEWVVKTELKVMKNKNSTYIPAMRPGVNNTDDFINWASTLLG